MYVNKTNVKLTLHQHLLALHGSKIEVLLQGC